MNNEYKIEKSSKLKGLPEGWAIKKFSKCIKQINTGLNPRDNFKLGSGNIKYITAKNLTRFNTIDFSNCDYVDNKAKEIIHKRSDIQKGDILFSSRAPVGQCHLIKEDPDFYDIAESIFSIRIDKKVIMPEYLCLYLSSNHFISMASKNTTGSIISEIRISDLKNTEVIIPPFEVQKNISDFINKVDDKLYYNLKIIEELDRLAKTLYEYWFLQFDFPDENGQPYKSSGGEMNQSKKLNMEIPKDWKVINLGKYLNFDKGFEPGQENYLPKNNNLIPFYKVGNIDNEVKEYIEPDLSDIRVKESDILLSLDGTPGKLAFGLNGAYSSGLRKVYDKQNIISNGLIFEILSSDYIQKTIEKHSTGSNILHASSALNYMYFPFNEYVINKLNPYFEKIFESKVKLKQENIYLQSLKAWLLPMLINGQAKIK